MSTEWCPLCGWELQPDGLHVLEDEVRVWCRRDGGWYLLDGFG